MSRWSIARLGLMVAACALAAGVPAHAWTCTGTITPVSADVSTSPGTGCGNNYTAAQSSNNVRQCLQEGWSSGVSKLQHTWRIDNVPAGQLSLIIEGFRPNNLDGDDFKFSGTYNQGGGATGFILGTLINSAREEPGGVKHDMQILTEATSTIYLTIKDTTGGTNSLDTVELDHVAICSEPLE